MKASMFYIIFKMHKINQILPNKILHWYDNNKRTLPWRNKKTQSKKEYYTLVSEFMLQQTQVKTVIPYFNFFIKKIPNLKKLSKTSENTLLKIWQGLGYYSRVQNLKKTARIIIDKHKGKMPQEYNQLVALPGIGEYTASALLAIVFNKKIIPLDGNIKRLLKRIFNLKFSRNLNNFKTKLGYSERSSDYAQALMELGALICKPKNPLCNKCPITSNCLSFKKNDFVIQSKIKKEKNKYFEVNFYENKNKILLIKNDYYKFLKNLLIFPMNEIPEKNFFKNSKKIINVKMSNMNIKIKVNFLRGVKKINNSQWIEKSKFSKYTLPSFTKRIYKSIQNQI